MRSFGQNSEENKEEPTENEYLKRVQEDWRAIRDIPPDKLTESICLAAVSKNGGALGFIPDEHCSEAVCLAAVKQDGMALQLVPEARQSASVCLAAVSQNWEALQFVPYDLRSEEIYLQVVCQNGMALEFIPEARRSASICLAAVLQNWEALQFVPEEKRSDDIYLAVLQQNGRELEFIPEARRNALICLTAVYENWQALQFVPENHWQMIQQFFSNLAHIVIVDKDEWNLAEIKKSWLVYANKEKRRNKTLRVFRDEIDEFMEAFCMMNILELEMVLLGHGYLHKIAEIDAPQLVSYLEKYPEIIKVKLLACYSVRKKEGMLHWEEQEALENLAPESSDEIQAEASSNLDKGYISKKDPDYAFYKRTHPSERGLNMEWEAGCQAYFEDSLLSRAIEGVLSSAQISRQMKLKGYYGLVCADSQEGGFHSIKNMPGVHFFNREVLKKSREIQDTFKSLTVIIPKKAQAA